MKLLFNFWSFSYGSGDVLQSLFLPEGPGFSPPRCLL